MTTTPDFRAQCAELLAAIQLYTGLNPAASEMSSVEKTEKLMDAMAATVAALATQPPGPPTEQKSSINELIAGCKPLDPEMAKELTTEVRWRLFGEQDSVTPPPAPLRPIPVSERLPRPGDCADELCWMWESDINGHEDLGHWLLEHRNWVSDPEADCTHWLPHNAIPFPEVTQ